MRALIANGLALAIGAVLAAGLGEIGLRLLAPQATGPAWFAHDPDLGAIPVPGAQGERALPGVYRFSFTHDDQGLRVDPAAPGLVATRTVLVLGDSYTYGLGVNDDQTYCHLLQRALPSDPPTRVVNGGCPAKGTDYALRFVLARQAALQPDLVILAFFKNDFGDNARDAYFSLTPAGALEPRPPPDTRSARRRLLERIPGCGWLLSRSHLVNLVRRAAVLLTLDPGSPGQPTGVLEPEEGPRAHVWVDPARRERTRRYLAELRDTAESRGASLLVFYVPDRTDCWLARAGRALSPDERAFREIAAELDLWAFSLTPALAVAPEPLERLYLPDGHWAPAAHARVARVLLEPVRRGVRSGT